MIDSINFILNGVKYLDMQKLLGLGIKYYKLKYKKDVKETDKIVAQLKTCADSIEMLDYQMQEIRDKIYYSNE